jgi:SHAQKYF class myb-like DNA-binding protein
MLNETDNSIPSLKLPEMTLSSKRNEKLNSGRWKPNEHDKFLEAIIIHGNDWKLVQKCIKSRSSTQARSHAQKFLLKLRKKLKIEPDSNNKLSNESIDKIVKEIIENSCLRSNHIIDKEKLVKLIMGFSNLLVGKVSPQSAFPENTSNNYFFNNQDSYFDNNVPFQNSFFKSDCSDGGKKVFNIEKVFKGDRKLSINVSNADTMVTDKSKRSDASCFFNGDSTKGHFQINQINNQNDLIKYLFQNPQQDPSNPNKNVINIISINICNKNDGENINNNQANPFTNQFLNSTSDNNSNAQRKAILNILGTSFPNNNLNNLKLVSTTPLIIPNKGVVSNKEDGSAVIKPDEIKYDVHSISVNKGTTVSSPNSNNFEQDFYENSNGSPNYFNQMKTDEDEYDKFFEWN